MTTVPRFTPITTGGHRRPKPPVDKEARLWFIYSLDDAAGVPIYVGRSVNVAARIRGHDYEARTVAPYKAEWLPDVRGVSMTGPYTYDQAVREERRQIKTLGPRGNRTGVPKTVAS